MKDGIKTNENFRVQVEAAGYRKEDVKIKIKVLDDKTNVLVIDVGASSADGKFGIYKNLPAFKKEVALNKEIYDLTKITASVENGVIEVVIPKKDEYRTKTIIDFSPSDGPADGVPETPEN